MTSALIVVDVQQGFGDPRWGAPNNPACEENIRALVGAWRARGWPLVFVRHDSLEADSPLAAGSAGNALSPLLEGEPDLLVVKHVNSAFYGTPDLHGWLAQRSIDALTICGITTNHCCETTARMAGNLGYDTHFVLDATRTFDLEDLDGRTIAADEVARVSAANLHGEFATVTTTAATLATAAT